MATERKIDNYIPLISSCDIMGLPTGESSESNDANQQLGEDGIVEVGARILQGQTYIHSSVPGIGVQNLGHRPVPMKNKLPEEVYADQVMLAGTDTEDVLIKVLLRQTRIPEVGDKFSSRHGQKGVCG